MTSRTQVENRTPQETVPLPAFEIKFDPVGIGDLLEIARAAMEELLWCGRVQ